MEVGDDGDVGCPQCKSDGNMVDNLSTQLSLLAKKCAKYAFSVDFDDIIMSRSSEIFYAVHKSDLAAFQKFCKNFRENKTKREPEVIRQGVLDLFRPQERPLNLISLDNEISEIDSLDEIDRRMLELVAHMTRPLRCRSHKLPLSNIVTISSPDSLQSMSEHVSLLDQSSHNFYVASLCALARILILSEEKQEINVVDEEEDTEFLDCFKKLCSERGIFEWHPFLIQSNNGPEKRTVAMKYSTGTVLLRWTMDICTDNKCFVDYQRRYLTGSQNGGTKVSSHGAKDDPILIDVSEQDIVPFRNTFPLTVLEMEPDASEERIIESLAQYSGTPSEDGSVQGLRRSTRRRKTRLPTGVFTSEETVQMDIANNVAALRLLLLESCAQGMAYSLDHCLWLVVTPVDTRAEPDTKNGVGSKPSTLVKLDFAKNQSSLLDLGETALGGDLSSLVPRDSFVVIRQAVPDESTFGIEDGRIVEDLIALSNLSCPPSNEKKRKVRVVERGFTGTLLSTVSGSSKKPRNDDGKQEELVSNPPLEQPSPSQCRVLVATDRNQQKEETALCNGGPPKIAHADLSKSTSSSDAVQIEDDDPSTDANTSTPAVSPGREELLYHVRDKLSNNPAVNRGHVKHVWEASDWATKENTAERDVEALANLAFAKYLDLTME